MRIRNGCLYSGCKNRCVISIGSTSVKCAWLIMRICAFVMCIIIFIHRVRHLITNLLLLDWIITYCYYFATVSGCGVLLFFAFCFSTSLLFEKRLLFFLLLGIIRFSFIFINNRTTFHFATYSINFVIKNDNSKLNFCLFLFSKLISISS